MKLKQTIFGVGAWMLTVSTFAQIDVQCKIEPSTVIQYELIKAIITIQNNTGETLSFSGKKANCTLDFNITDLSGILAEVEKNKAGRVPALTLAPATQVVFTNYINDLYNFHDLGAYAIQADIAWSDQHFISEKTHVDIVSGTELDRLRAGLPGKGKASRTYSLWLVNRDYVDRLFLRIDDEDNKLCYGVFDLGGLMRIGDPPRVQIDADGNVHVLHKSAPTQYSYSIFTPNGGLVDQKQYTGQYTQMHMQSNEKGKIEVKGSQFTQEELSPFKTINRSGDGAVMR